ncbi:MAG: hypothetical protein ACRDNW_02665, partial [Trebonia sp.]
MHWQAGDRPLPAPAVNVAGESAQWVDPAEIPSDGDVARLGQALAGGAHGDRDELMSFFHPEFVQGGAQFDRPGRFSLSWFRAVFECLSNTGPPAVPALRPGNDHGRSRSAQGSER